jgi:uroporphyrinogen III methyltransferase / synthase
MTANRGKVFLVGAGPGDPGLLTLRAAELLESADVVATDALVSAAVLGRVRKEAEVIFVGKRAGVHAVSQVEINRLLIEKARAGKRVVRLKGGDPFVFGRGGEEAEELAAAGIAFEVVPGISSAIAGPAYAGIPVTHRAHSASVTIVTGHESDDSAAIDWRALAALRGTTVFMMGAANLSLITTKLREHGMPANQPAAVVAKATTPEQSVIIGTLGDISARASGMSTPAIIVVGDVVQLRETINWFESKPLFGKRVVVTRARDQASELKRLLEEAGAQVIEFPLIEIGPPESFQSLDRTIDALDDTQWVIFTSTNGVRSFFERLRFHGKDGRALHGVMIAAIGESTAEELRARGIEADLVPQKFQSSALLPLLEQDQRGIRTAIVRAAEGREELIDELRRRGGEVDLAVAYRTTPVAVDVGLLDRVDIITFTSASTVENFFTAAGQRAADILKMARVASIGPITSDALRKHGRAPDVEAASASIEALRDAIIEAF